MRIFGTYYANIRNLSGNYIVVHIDKYPPPFTLEGLPHYNYPLLAKNTKNISASNVRTAYRELLNLSIMFGGADIILCGMKKNDSHRSKLLLLLSAHIGYLLPQEIVELPQSGTVVKMAVAA